MAVGAVLGGIGMVAGAAALVWTWQVSQQVAALDGENMTQRVATLEEQAGTPEAVAEALAAKIADDAALADLLRGPEGPQGAPPAVDAVAAALMADHAEALSGPQGASGPAGADAVAPSPAEIAQEILALAGDTLTGPPGEPGPAGPPGPTGGLPAGSVLAVQSEACPEGWAPAEATRGRFILGAGAGAGGSSYAVGETGGGASHNHGVTVNLMPAGTVAEDPAGTVSPAAAGSASGVAEHSLAMPPYLALTFCTPAAP